MLQGLESLCLLLSISFNGPYYLSLATVINGRGLISYLVSISVLVTSLISFFSLFLILMMRFQQLSKIQ